MVFETLTVRNENLPRESIDKRITAHVLENSWMGSYFCGKANLETVGKPFAKAYFFAGLMAEGLMPLDFSAKLHDFSRPDHGVPHLGRVLPDMIVSADHNPDFMELTVDRRNDVAMASMAAGATHDHLEIDAQIKPGHDHLGAVATAMMMLLARERGLPYSDSQIRLAFDAVYHHSYRDSVDAKTPPVAQIFEQYDSVYSEKSPLWRDLKDKFQAKGWKIEDLDFELTHEEAELTPLVRDRLYAADKRDTVFAPPFLTLVRTMATLHKGEIKPFIAAEGLFQPLDYFLNQNFKDTQDVMIRVIYELMLDLEAKGFNEFERGWTYELAEKKLGYVMTIASDLAKGASLAIARKFNEYLGKIESYPAGCGNKPDLKRLIMAEWQATQAIFVKQSAQLKQDLEVSGRSVENYENWLKSLSVEVRSKMKKNGNHDYQELDVLPIHNTSLMIPIYK